MGPVPVGIAEEEASAAHLAPGHDGGEKLNGLVVPGQRGLGLALVAHEVGEVAASGREVGLVEGTLGELVDELLPDVDGPAIDRLRRRWLVALEQENAQVVEGNGQITPESCISRVVGSKLLL